MNLPNKLTLLRAASVPVLLAVLLHGGENSRWIGALIFAAASLTDMLDGYLARKNDQITNFGKFLDPLADKLLVIGALVAFVQIELASAWLAMLIITRELAVTSIRLVASGADGTVIAASVWGKLKTVSQIIAVIAVLLEDAWIPATNGLIGTVCLWISAALTLYSGWDYLRSYWKYIRVE